MIPLGYLGRLYMVISCIYQSNCLLIDLTIYTCSIHRLSKPRQSSANMRYSCLTAHLDNYNGAFYWEMIEVLFFFSAFRYARWGGACWIGRCLFGWYFCVGFMFRGCRMDYFYDCCVHVGAVFCAFSLFGGQGCIRCSNY